MSNRYNLYLTLLLLCSNAVVGCSVLEQTNTLPANSEPSYVASEPLSSPIRDLGHDLLGAQHPRFDYRTAAKFIPSGAPLGFLDGTFSTSLASPEFLVCNLRPRVVRVHILNTVCVRNGNCGRYEPLVGYSLRSLDQAIQNKNPKILNYLSVRVAAWRDLSGRCPSQYVVSPALEHNLSPQSWRILADTVQSVWGGVQLSNSAMNCQGEAYRGAWRECHGKSPGGSEISSLDGADLMDIDVTAWLRNTSNNRITFRWSRGYNCRDQAESFTDPRNRKQCPKPYQFEEYEHATDGVPSPLPSSFSCTPINANSIWKPSSEDKGIADPRANKPVLISRHSGPVVNLVDRNGKKVGTLGLYGDFAGGRRRYYSGFRGGSGQGGYEYQKAAQASSGSPYVYAKGGGTCVGPFVPGRRQGDYR